MIRAELGSRENYPGKIGPKFAEVYGDKVEFVLNGEKVCLERDRFYIYDGAYVIFSGFTDIRAVTYLRFYIYGINNYGKSYRLIRSDLKNFDTYVKRARDRKDSSAIYIDPEQPKKFIESMLGKDAKLLDQEDFYFWKYMGLEKESTACDCLIFRTGAKNYTIPDGK
jgi:hypothetical protein